MTTINNKLCYLLLVIIMECLNKRRLVANDNYQNLNLNCRSQIIIIIIITKPKPHNSV